MVTTGQWLQNVAIAIIFCRARPLRPRARRRQPRAYEPRSCEPGPCRAIAQFGEPPRRRRWQRRQGQAWTGRGEASGGRHPGAALRQDPFGAVGRLAGGLCGTIATCCRMPAKRGHIRRPASRRFARHRDQDDCASQARRARDRAALSRRIPDREGKRWRSARIRHRLGGRRSVRARRADRIGGGGRRGHRASRLGNDAEGLRALPRSHGGDVFPTGGRAELVSAYPQDAARFCSGCVRLG